MKGSSAVAKKRSRVPIWLRRLDLVAQQMRGERGPGRGAEERIDMVLSLMAEGLASLHAQAGGRRRREAGIMPTARDQLSAFHRLDAEWVRRWKRERGQAFGR